MMMGREPSGVEEGPSCSHGGSSGSSPFFVRPKRALGSPTKIPSLPFGSPAARRDAKGALPNRVITLYVGAYVKKALLKKIIHRRDIK